MTHIGQHIVDVPHQKSSVSLIEHIAAMSPDVPHACILRPKFLKRSVCRMQYRFFAVMTGLSLECYFLDCCCTTRPATSGQHSGPPPTMVSPVLTLCFLPALQVTGVDFTDWGQSSPASKTSGWWPRWQLTFIHSLSSFIIMYA